MNKNDVPDPYDTPTQDDVKDLARSRVKLLDAYNFNTIVNDESKDILLTFFAPWSLPSKKLKPVLKRLADIYKDDDGIEIVAMDTSSQKVPQGFEVKVLHFIFYHPLMILSIDYDYYWSPSISFYNPFLYFNSVCTTQGLPTVFYLPGNDKTNRKPFEGSTDFKYMKKFLQDNRSTKEAIDLDWGDDEDEEVEEDDEEEEEESSTTSDEL